MGGFHSKGDLRKDYLYGANLSHRFWLGWMQEYLPTLQGRNKWRVTRENLKPGQLILVGDAEDLSNRGLIVWVGLSAYIHKFVTQRNWFVALQWLFWVKVSPGLMLNMFCETFLKLLPCDILNLVFLYFVFLAQFIYL